jgi:hypothetical protein
MTPEERLERKRAIARAKGRRYRERHPERSKAHVHNWAKDHPRDLRAYMKEYHQRPEVKERHRVWARQHARVRRLAAYGITPDDYDSLLARQGGVCAICTQPPMDRGLGVDHHHETGLVRGLLCRTCNLVVGMLNESAEAAERAATYLRGALAPIAPYYLPPEEGLAPRCSFARPASGYQCAHKTNHPTGRCWRHRDGSS